MCVILTAQQFIFCYFQISFISNLEGGNDISVPAFYGLKSHTIVKRFKKLSVFLKAKCGKTRLPERAGAYWIQE